MPSKISLALLALAGTALTPAIVNAAAPEMTVTTFEMFNMVPGQTENFLRGVADYDKASVAGGQPKSQVFLHENGEGWDVLLFKPSRPKPSAAQEAAMAATTKQLGLLSGPMYFLDVRKRMADHVHFEATGPYAAAEWLHQLDRQRAELTGKPIPPAPNLRPVPVAAAGPGVEMTVPTFEMFRLAPGKAEEFIRDMAAYDEVSVAGGQPRTQLYLHAGGESWDVLLYKEARPKPTAAQQAAMAAKTKELGLETGPLYYLKIRQWMVNHTHFEGNGPLEASDWVASLEKQRAEFKAGK